MIVRFTNAYREAVNEFIRHNETKLSLKPRIREINEKLSETESPMNWTLGVLMIDSPFEPTSLKTIACLYTRHPEKDDEIAPCLLYFPYDAAVLSISQQDMKKDRGCESGTRLERITYFHQLYSRSERETSAESVTPKWICLRVIS